VVVGALCFEVVQLLADLCIASVQLALQVHGKTLVRISSLLERTAYLTDFHISVLLDRSLVQQGFKLGLLLSELFNLNHDHLSFLKLLLLSEL
jgi:hypothetical protein